jgi:hypothetical protein
VQKFAGWWGKKGNKNKTPAKKEARKIYKERKKKTAEKKQKTVERNRKISEGKKSKK